MELEHAIGRRLMLGFRGASMDDPLTRADVADLKKVHAGGVILFDKDLGTGGERNIRSAEQLKKLIEDLRHELGDELIVAIDEEGGAVSRLESILPQSISASDLAQMPPEAIRGYANGVAGELKRLGITLNFSPCVDLAINRSSSVITQRGRSFGTDPTSVVDCAKAVIDAHQKHGVRCCIKHFPGHGSASGDTHKGFVDITETHQADEIEPYRQLIEHFGDALAVMTGHLIHRSHDPHFPASLSHAMTTGWLREGLGFNGIVVTDSLDMGGMDPSPLHAEDAGADIFLYGNNTPEGFIPEIGSWLHNELAVMLIDERAFEVAARIDRVFR